MYRKHVLGDLRPYVCTVKECISPNDSFASRAEYMNHKVICVGHSQLDHNVSEGLVTSNAQGSNNCLFCGEETDTVKDGRSRHIERHMEEVAFMVVSRPYEEWDFYSDSSANESSAIY